MGFYQNCMIWHKYRNAIDQYVDLVEVLGMIEWVLGKEAAKSIAGKDTW